MRFLAVIGLFLVATQAFAGETFKGKFGSINAQSGCEYIFKIKEYDVQHHLTGADGYTSVIHMEQGSQPGFFDNLNIVGRFDYNGEIISDKTFSRDGINYQLAIEGLLGPTFIVLNVTVAILNASDEPACKAIGEFYGSEV